MEQAVTLNNAPVSQPFGVNAADYARFGIPGHNGLDLAVPVGTQLYAPFDGLILEVGNDPDGYGLYLKVGEQVGRQVLLAHLSTVGATKEGDTVIEGTPIALSGTSGNSTGPHVHVGYRPVGTYRATPYGGFVDPAPFLDALP